MIKYFFVSFGILMGFVLFESAILSNILFLPVIPDFVLLCVLYISVTHGRTIGVSTGFCSGLLIDFFSGCPFGLNSLTRTLIGYISGFFSNTFNTTGILLPVVIVLMGTISKSLLQTFISFFYPNIVNSYSLFSFTFLSELTANALFAPIIFKFLSFFDSIYPEMDRTML